MADEPYEAEEVIEQEDIATEIWRQLEVNQSQLEMLRQLRVVQRINCTLLAFLLLVVLFVAGLGIEFAFDYLSSQFRAAEPGLFSPYAYALAIVLGVLAVLVLLAYLLARALARVCYRSARLSRLVRDQLKILGEAQRFLGSTTTKIASDAKH